MTPTRTPSSSLDHPPDQSAINRQRAIVIVGAIIVALVIWVIAGLLLGVDLSAETGSGSDARKIGPIAIIVVTALAGLMAWALLAILERTTSRPIVIWTSIAVVALVISLLGPTSGTTTAAQVTLFVMHLVTGAILITGLSQTARRRT